MTCFCLDAEENFMLIESHTNKVIKEFGPNLHERVTPASTFKIALSLIGFDAEILKDETTPKWSFEEGYDDFLESWKFSQTPKTWMARSCVWYSKLMTYKLGIEKFQHYLDMMNYGNKDLSTGLVSPGPLGPAWVSSSIKISPKEQVIFLRNMLQRNLSISDHAIEMTKAILFREEIKGWKLYGKTGLGTIYKSHEEPEKVRWFVGWLEGKGMFFPFAYQMRAKHVDVNQALIRVERLLSEYIIR